MRKVPLGFLWHKPSTKEKLSVDATKKCKINVKYSAEVVESPKNSLLWQKSNCKKTVTDKHPS